MPRQDFLLQPNTDSQGNVYYDFPLDDTVIDGVYLPTPYGNSDNQHIIDIIFIWKGAIKQFPLLGFGLFQYQNGEYNKNLVFSSLSDQMKSDGYLVKNGAISSDGSNGFNIDTDFIFPNY